MKRTDLPFRAFAFQPSEGKGPWPALLFYMDGVGIRPALFEMGERMANEGYVVLLPDMFHRGGEYEPQDPMKIFTDPVVGGEWRKKIGGLTYEQAMDDTRACLAWFDAQPNVKKGAIGITGYCMGGRLALWAAATFPDRVAAAAAFHPGGLVTDAPDSAHRMVDKIKAEIYVGGAKDDAHFTDAHKATLEQALADAGVPHTVTTYDAKHGWVPSDTPIHDDRATERHYEALFALLKSRIS